MVSYLNQFPTCYYGKERNSTELHLQTSERDCTNHGFGYFINEYLHTAPLNRQVYLTDAAGVHIYIIKLTSENPVAEAKMVENSQKNDGRLDFITLKMKESASMPWTLSKLTRSSNIYSNQVRKSHTCGGTNFKYS